MTKMTKKGDPLVEMYLINTFAKIFEESGWSDDAINAWGEAQVKEYNIISVPKTPSKKAKGESMDTPWWAEKIRLLRQGLGLTQAAVGAKVGISRDYLSRLENGRHIPRIDTLEKIFSALGHNMAAAAPKTSAKAIAWLKRNRWIQEGTQKSWFALSIHEGLVARGVDPESDEYYQELDRRLEAFDET
jgi:transcriptional regulator with XRE-family HTH domain